MNRREEKRGGSVLHNKKHSEFSHHREREKGREEEGRVNPSLEVVAVAVRPPLSLSSHPHSQSSLSLSLSLSRNRFASCFPGLSCAQEQVFTGGGSSLFTFSLTHSLSPSLTLSEAGVFPAHTTHQPQQGLPTERKGGGRRGRQRARENGRASAVSVSTATLTAGTAAEG